MPTPRVLGRRRFLLLAGLVLVALIVSFPLLLGGSDTRLVGFVKAMIRKNLPSLEHDDDEMDRFAVDYLADLHESMRSQLPLLAALRLVYANTDVLEASPLNGRIGIHERRLLPTYLMSTDLFFRDQESQAPLAYIGLYAPPYYAPCRNPFATFS